LVASSFVNGLVFEACYCLLLVFYISFIDKLCGFLLFLSYC